MGHKETLMIVVDANLASGNKRSRVRKGVYIDYISIDNVIKGDIVGITVSGKEHYFEVSDITITEDRNLKVSARETGYYGSKFENDSTFDLRDLINITVTNITDEDVKKKIYNDSCLC